MVGVVFALEEEAKQVMQELNLEKVVYNGRTFYVNSERIPKSNRIIVVISGIGKVNAQIATSILISIGCDRIVNIGTAGTVANRFSIGDLVEPNVFFDGDFDFSEAGFSTKDPALVNRERVDNPVVCYTYSAFTPHKRAEQGIIDMEAYAVVAQCRAFDIPVEVYKVVSDGNDIKQFNKVVSKCIIPHVKKLLEVINK